MCKDLATLKLSTHEAMQCGLVSLLVNVRFEGIVLTRSTRRSSVQFSSIQFSSAHCSSVPDTARSRHIEVAVAVAVATLVAGGRK